MNMPQQKRCRVALSSDSSSGSGLSPKEGPDTAEKCRNTVAAQEPLEAIRKLSDKFEKLDQELRKELSDGLDRIRDLIIESMENIIQMTSQPVFVIHGLPEPAGEDSKTLEKHVIKFMKNTMKIPQNDAKDMVDVVFRLGKSNQNHPQNHHLAGQKGRPVLLKLLRGKHREIFRSHLRNITDPNLKVDSYLTPEERRIKNILMKYRKEAKSRGQEVKMLGNTVLRINSKYYTVVLDLVQPMEEPIKYKT